MDTINPVVKGYGEGGDVFKQLMPFFGIGVGVALFLLLCMGCAVWARGRERGRRDENRKDKGKKKGESSGITTRVGSGA